jgi:hypothetical protein
MNGMKRMSGMSMSNKKFKMSISDAFASSIGPAGVISDDLIVNKVASIKAFRALTNNGLKVSKDAIERCWAGYDHDTVWTILADIDYHDVTAFRSVYIKDQLDILRDNGIKVDLISTNIANGIYNLIGQALEQDDYWAVNVLSTALNNILEPYETFKYDD